MILDQIDLAHDLRRLCAAGHGESCQSTLVLPPGVDLGPFREQDSAPGSGAASYNQTGAGDNPRMVKALRNFRPIPPETEADHKLNCADSGEAERTLVR